MEVLYDIFLLVFTIATVLVFSKFKQWKIIDV